MAIKSDISIEAFGTVVVLNGMYVRVSSVIGTKSLVRFVVDVSHDMASPSVHRMEYSFVPDMDGGNFIRQAYVHLKSLPEFSAAIDC